MTLSAAYDDTRSCVQLTLSDLYPQPNGAVRLERAALDPQPPWETVRGTVNLPLINPDGLRLTGDTGDYASTPDKAQLDVTGDIDLRADVTLDNWSPGTNQTLVAKYDTTTDNRSYQMFITGAGELAFGWSTDGVGFTSQSMPIPSIPSSNRLAVRTTLDVDNGSSQHVTSFYVADSINGPWTLIGTITNSGTTSIFASTADLVVGGRDGGTANMVSGLAHAAEVYDGIDGMLVADPYFANETAMTTSFDDSSGNTWTVNGYAEIERDIWAQVCDYEFFAGSFCDEETVDSTNYYRAIRVEPEPGLFLSGELGDYASAPDATQLDVTGDIDLRADVTLDDWTSTSQALIGKFVESGDQRSYALRVLSDGSLRLSWSEDGISGLALDSTASVTSRVGNGERLTIRVNFDVDDGAGNHIARFYTSSSLSGPWELLGSAVVGSGTTMIFASTAPLEIGSRNMGTTDLASGTVHEAKVLDGINGTEVANPDFAAQDSQTTSFTDDAGNTWSVNGDARILGEDLGGANTASVEPILEDIWLISLLHPNVSLKLPGADFRPVQRSSRTGLYNIKGKVNPIAVHDAWTSRWWTIETVTYLLEEAAIMDLSVLTTGTWFIQVPPECENECLTNPVTGMPGGYVALMNATMTHEIGGTHAMEWVLFVRQVEPPAPEVSGTTITWSDVMTAYGSWSALWASNPSWRALWQRIGDPENAVSF